MTIVLDQIRQMPVAERIQLVEDIWDTVAMENADVSLSDLQMEELERRRSEMLANPSVGIPWTEAKKRLFASD